MNKYLFWDFDGTLGGRIDGHRGRAWAMSMLEAIEQVQPGSRFTVDDIVTHLRRGFPWHEPEKGHLHLNTSELWWEHIRNIFVETYIELGFSSGVACELAELAQERFLDLDTWELFDDTVPVLGKLLAHGWKHIIVSNHVPELALIARHLGLDGYVSHIINSAVVGYEKPNPRIYEAALAETSEAEELWMIGDNINADVFGAEDVGIKAILVRNMDKRAKYNFVDLYGVEEFLLADS